jgi:hypothetical protein
MCLRGASALQQLLDRDSTRLAIIVLWEHVTVSDRKMGIPTTRVLARLSDRRARQFWDPQRVVSYTMVRDLPRDTLASVAEIDSTGAAVVWDCLALFKPGVRWDDRFPVPSWAGRPVIDVVDALNRKWGNPPAAADTAARR